MSFQVLFSVYNLKKIRLCVSSNKVGERKTTPATLSPHPLRKFKPAFIKFLNKLSDIVERP